LKRRRSSGRAAAEQATPPHHRPRRRIKARTGRPDELPAFSPAGRPPD